MMTRIAWHCTIVTLNSSLKYTLCTCTTISISNADRFLRLWNVSTGEELARVNTGTDVLSGVGFSADWSIFVTGSNTGLIRFFRKG